MSNKKLSPERTKLLLDHAVSSNANETAKKVAKYLKIEESRVSEGRRAEYRIDAALEECLIEKYGAPTGKPGVYIIAETTESIGLFIERVDRVSTSLHLEQLDNFYKAKHTKDSLADALEPPILEIGSLDTTARKRKHSAKSQNDRLKRLEKLRTIMLTDGFNEWLEEVSSAITQTLSPAFGFGKEILDTDITKLNGEWLESTIINGEIGCPEVSSSFSSLTKESGLFFGNIPLLYLFCLGKFIQARKRNLDHYFTYLNNGAKNSDQNEYVITGKIIWAEKNPFSIIKPGKIAFHPLSEIASNQIKQVIWMKAPGDKNSSLFGGFWEHYSGYSIKLYHQDTCVYTLTVVLHSSLEESCDWNIIIPKISSIHLFKELEHLRKWLELPEIPLVEIKTKIAELGGYVPGTIVI